MPALTGHGPVHVLICHGCHDRMGVYAGHAPRKWRLVKGRWLCPTCYKQHKLTT